MSPSRLLGAVLLGTALALVAMPAARAADDAVLRIAHLSPDTPAVDVAIAPAAGSGAPVHLAAVGYGDVPAPVVLPPGAYTVALRTAGAGVGAPPVLSARVELGAGDARTVAAVGRFADLALAVLEEDLTPPPPGSARVRVLAAAADAPALDVSTADGTVLADDLPFAGAGPYTAVPAGPATLRVTAGGTPTDVPVDLVAGAVHSLLVLDRPGSGVTVRLLLDAAGAAVVPAGGVEAGAGGTAGGAASPGGSGAGAALAAAALAAAALARTVVARTAVARTAVARTAPARTAVARTAPARTAPARTAPARTAVARTAPARTAPARAAAAGTARRGRGRVR